MAVPFSDAQIKQALEQCAAEPVHIPGCVQPYGALVAFDTQTHSILYASENCEALIGRSAESRFGASFRDVFEPEIIHAINNVAGQPKFAQQAVPVGRFDVNGAALALHVFASQGLTVVEF